MARRLLALTLLALAFAAIALWSPELRRLARPPLERLGALRPYQEGAHYLETLERHRRENAGLHPPCVILLGDSLTEQFPARLAAPRGWVVRGISGDRVRHLQARLEGSVLDAPCASIAVLAGTNDVVSDGAPPGQVALQVASLAEALRAGGKQIVVTTVPPVGGRFAAANGNIRSLNDRIRALAGDRLDVLDLHSALVGDAGELDVRYSRDGLHLTGAGYERWVELLAAALSEQQRRARKHRGS